MDKEIVLEVKNVSKSFLLSHYAVDSFKQYLTELFRAKTGLDNIFWALKNISFSVFKGEVVGIIGKNGAGKSTLLKILSGITPPDEGEINFYGKVVSILEIGAGFHPDLTGRENIFLTASLYKFTRTETEAKLNDIIAFSGVADFIDEPVKNYSSGMYLRLAFSILAHLNADIYLIDEVISVGDANFQNKCKIRFQEMVAAGKTVLLASHNMNELMTLSNRIILMEQGEIKEIGGHHLIQQYISHSISDFSNLDKTGFINNKNVNELIHRNHKISVIRNGVENYCLTDRGISSTQGFHVYFEFDLLDDLNVAVVLRVYDSTGVLVFTASSIFSETKITAKGKYRVVFKLPPYFFNERIYVMDVMFADIDRSELICVAEDFLTVKIADEEIEDAELRNFFIGVVKPRVESVTEKLS